MGASQEKRVLFIGGLSASGKTSVAVPLAHTLNCRLVRLDGYLRAVETLDRPGMEALELTRKISELLLLDLLGVRARCMVEGATLRPSQAAELKQDWPTFEPVFCGYPNADPEERIAQMRSTRPPLKPHWSLSRLSDKELTDFLQEQIERSAWLQAACRKHDLRFFDFSNFDQGARDLSDHFGSCGFAGA